jgi:hypothetical protein
MRLGSGGWVCAPGALAALVVLGLAAGCSGGGGAVDDGATEGEADADIPRDELGAEDAPLDEPGAGEADGPLDEVGAGDADVPRDEVGEADADGDAPADELEAGDADAPLDEFDAGDVPGDEPGVEDAPVDELEAEDGGGEADGWTPAESQLTAVWANTGEDKVTKGDLRATADPAAVRNSAWDGERVSLFAARNEVVAFALVLEAGERTAADVSVAFDRLDGPGGFAIVSRAASGDGVFDWTGRPIELFFVRYLQIRGLSRAAYEMYDERHVPERFRRPWSGEGFGTGGWEDRPDHDKFYPEIAVPLELVPEFDIPAGESQIVWVDVYVPRDAPAGSYAGTVTISEGGEETRRVPVALDVRAIALPDTSRLGSMIVVGYGDPNTRYLGEPFPSDPDLVARARVIRDRHFQLAHRHRLSLIGDTGSEAWDRDEPRPDWGPRLDGTLFTAASGYDGPGAGVGNGVYSIGTYGSWSWREEDEAAMRTHTDGWATWFAAHAPGTTYFLYLIDESSDFPQIERWASWIRGNPGPGSAVLSMATIGAPDALAHTPSLDIATSTLTVGITDLWQTAVDAFIADPRRRIFFYNGKRPAAGSFATEDDGVALRVLAWAQYKKRIERWFFWESTYYNNFQGGTGQTNVFRTARTFGADGGFDPELGESGWMYSNGDGVLFYPGTDLLFPVDSYGVAGPFASLRMKTWRRGIQDGEYLALAEAVDAEAVEAIVARMVPLVMWEYGVDDPGDPTWVRADISWSTDPDDWERARGELAGIIEGP